MIELRLREDTHVSLERGYDFVLDDSHFAIVGRCTSCAEVR